MWCSTKIKCKKSRWILMKFSSICSWWKGDLWANGGVTVVMWTTMTPPSLLTSLYIGVEAMPCLQLTSSLSCLHHTLYGFGPHANRWLFGRATNCYRNTIAGLSHGERIFNFFEKIRFASQKLNFSIFVFLAENQYEWPWMAKEQQKIAKPICSIFFMSS